MSSYTQQAQSQMIVEQASMSQVKVAAPSRREFLYYIWAASMMLLVGEATAGIIWFAMPRFREGTFGASFRLSPDQLPTPGSAPNLEASGRFWIANVEMGVIILYVVCTHLGCIYKWVSTNNRFECPCHGSKFELNGTYIEGPAPRSLDRFQTTIVFTDGTSAATNEAGDPISIEGHEISEIIVDTGNRILRDGRT